MLSQGTANEIACSIVSSRLDYCNSVLFNTSASNIDRLQRLQNNLARIVCCAPARASAAPLLQKLHWLPIKHRINYKIACLSFSALYEGTPSYLRASLTEYAPQRTLRSSNARLLATPHNSRTLAIAKRSFTRAAPCIWKSLSLNTAVSLDVLSAA